MPKKHILFWLSFFACFQSRAQNLVPNPGFEEYISCPSATGKRQTSIISWMQATGGALDYFNRCSKAAGVPQNSAGKQDAKNGDAYIGIIAYHDKLRSYAQAELKQALIAGTIYHVEFSVCLAENSKYAVGNIGAFFSAEKIESKHETVYECSETIDDRGTKKVIYGLCKPQVRNSTSSFITDVDEWTTISGSFKAKGGEKYITIGNFYSTEGTPALQSNGKNPYAYYYVDDVALYQTGTKPEPFPRGGFIPEEAQAVYRNQPVANNETKKTAQSKMETKNASITTEYIALADNRAKTGEQKETLNTKTIREEKTEKVISKTGEKKTSKQPVKETQTEKSNQQDAEIMEAMIEKALAEKQTKESKAKKEAILKQSQQSDNNEPGNQSIVKLPSAASEGELEAMVEKALAEKMKQKTPEQQAKAKATILRQLYFEKNSAVILPESEDQLIMLAELMTENSEMKIEIAGHTDETGTEELNKQLSLQRAQAVVNFLIMLDIEPYRLSYKGYGSTRPLFNNDTPEGREKNRRVEFRVVQ